MGVLPPPPPTPHPHPPNTHTHTYTHTQQQSTTRAFTQDTPTHGHAQADSALKMDTTTHQRCMLPTLSNRMKPPENMPACTHQNTGRAHMSTSLEHKAKKQHRNTNNHNILAHNRPHVLGFSILLFQYGNPLQGNIIRSLQGVVVTDGLLVFGLQEVVLLVKFGNIVQAAEAICLLGKQQVPHLLGATNRQGVHLPKLVHPERKTRWKLRTDCLLHLGVVF